MLGLDQIMPDIDWSNMGFSELVHDLQPVLPSFALGSTVLGIVSSALAYVLLYNFVVRHRKREQEK
jgi:uncharacterized protein (DUF2062 family)